MAWWTAQFLYKCKALQWVVKTAQYITGTVLPHIQDIYSKRCMKALASRTLTTPATNCSLPYSLPDSIEA
jgi:hypothetical protein